MPHPGVNNQWGPKLDEYLESIHSYIPRRKPSREQIKESYRTLYNSDISSSITCSVLEDVLLCLHYPDEFLQMLGPFKLHMWHVRIIEPILRHLEVYIKTNQLFDHYFGFLCVQVLAFSIQVEALVRHECLEAIVENIPEDSGPDIVSRMLSDNSTQLVISLGWPHGVNKQHHAFLLSILWKSRKSLFHVCRRVPGLHGWVILLMVIWVPLRSDPLGNATILSKLGDLMCRYTLAATEDNVGPIVQPAFQWTKMTLGTQGYVFKLPVVSRDVEETPIFHSALLSRLNSPRGERLDRHSTAVLAEFVFYYQAHSTTSMAVGPESKLFLEAVFERLWLEIADERCLMDIDYRLGAFELVIALLSIISLPFPGIAFANQFSRKSHSISDIGILDIPRVLYDADWIDMAGRIMFIVTLPLGGTQIPTKDLARFHKEQVISLLHTYCDVLKTYNLRALAIFRPKYQDWKKIYNFVELKTTAFQPDAAMIDYYSQIRQVWSHLGESLGFSAHAGHWCDYTGCTAAAVEDTSSMQICSRCLVAMYCSQRCQRSNWNYGHSLECRLQEQFHRA